MENLSTAKRRYEIQKILQDEGAVSSQKLSSLFNVSIMTIRRDLKYLDDKGIALRNHGGAIASNRFVFVKNLTQKAKEAIEAKKAIGQYAAKNLVSAANESIIVDAGSTTLEFVKHLPDTPINVMTNSLVAISTLAEHTHTNVYSVGGELQKGMMSFEGAMSDENLLSCNFSKAFIGVDGIDLQAGLTTTAEIGARLTRIMAEQSLEVYVLADTSKYNKRSFRTILGFNRITAIISNHGVPAEYKDFFAQKNIKLIEVGDYHDRK
ncbi:MAG: DeoR/GlpR family DNA-binding transcription regulator [Alphaproteobacteria bacterium]